MTLDRIASSMRLLLVSLGVAVALSSVSRGDEGYWLYTAPPLAEIERRYSAQLTPEWLDRLEYATVRVGAEGTSGAFVSPAGLILTARHVIPAPVRATIRDSLREGFVADTHAMELPLAGLTVDTLLEERDVTAELRKVEGRGDAASRGQRRARAIAGLTRPVRGDRDTIRQVVSLHGGSQYVLYAYRRYRDIRLVFAPEDTLVNSAAAYPGPILDFALLRAYEHGRPARPAHFLRLARNAPAEGSPVFISGAPYSGSWRRIPVAELATIHATDVPVVHEAMSKTYARLSAWLDRIEPQSSSGTEIAMRDRFFREVLEFERDALRDPAFLSRRREEEAGLRSSFSARHDSEGIQALETIDHLEAELAPLRVSHLLLPWAGDHEPIMWQGPDADLPWGAYLTGTTWIFAEVLLREREERQRADTERASGFRTADTAALKHWLVDGPCKVGCAPLVEPMMDEILIATYLETLREQLPPDDPLVEQLVGPRSPREVARELVSATRLGAADFRRQLLLASDADFAKVRDPLLDLLRAAQSEIRRRGRAYDALSTSLRSAADQLAAAEYRARGRDLYPETTGTFRLGFGAVTALERAPDELTLAPTPWYRLPAVTTARMLIDYTGHREVPLRLPPRWEHALAALEPATAVNFLSNVDGVAGNSGSVTVNADGDVVGVLFGGVGGGVAFEWEYEGALHRPEYSEHVATEILLESLRHIYVAKELLAELETPIAPPLRSSAHDQPRT